MNDINFSLKLWLEEKDFYDTAALNSFKNFTLFRHMVSYIFSGSPQISDDGPIRLSPEATYEKGNLIGLWLVIVSDFLFIST